MQATITGADRGIFTGAKNDGRKPLSPTPRSARELLHIFGIESRVAFFFII